MPKKDPPARRLAELFEYEKWLRARPRSSLAELGEPAEKWRNWRAHPIPGFWNDLNRLRELARQGKDTDANAFQIGGAPQSLKVAFKTFGLDRKNPWNWRQLLIYLAHTHFHKGSRGRPPSFDHQIIADYFAIRNEAKDKTDACRRMRRRYSRYRDVKAQTLTRRLNRTIRKIEGLLQNKSRT
jgi:hypothetical protein